MKAFCVTVAGVGRALTSPNTKTTVTDRSTAVTGLASRSMKSGSACRTAGAVRFAERTVSQGSKHPGFLPSRVNSPYLRCRGVAE